MKTTALVTLCIEKAKKTALSVKRRGFDLVQTGIAILLISLLSIGAVYYGAPLIDGAKQSKVLENTKIMNEAIQSCITASSTQLMPKFASDAAALTWANGCLSGAVTFVGAVGKAAPALADYATLNKYYFVSNVVANGTNQPTTWAVVHAPSPVPTSGSLFDAISIDGGTNASNASIYGMGSFLAAF